MLPKRQAKGGDQGPPKYQPPPQVNSKQFPNNNSAPFNGSKDGGQPPYPNYSNDPKSAQSEPRKNAPLLNGDSNKRSGSVPQPHPVGQGNEYSHPSKDGNPVRSLSPSRGIIRSGEDNLIIRNQNMRLPGEDARPSWRPLSDEELLQRPPHEILRVLRSAEAEVSRLSMEQGHMVREAKARLQASSNELRNAQDLVRRLQDDNQELRDLCCFLDDDRQKGRKLAREWQRFGRYTASVMRQEVSAYQGKLRELDNRQHELIRDNLELKELCLYLDEERGSHGSCASCGAALRPGTRDDGDGSSSSTNADEPPIPPHQPVAPTNFIQHQLVGYIRSLEQRVAQLEEERRVLQQRILQGPIVEPPANPRGNASTPSDTTSRPEAVVHALQVLQVREQLERALPPAVPPVAPVCIPPAPTLNVANPSLAELTTIATGGPAELDDGEKALVREMCN
ncbi:hypothetical protein B566_EDAN009281 [Ephemera danica]|nr:hypothetical protein B566_EDAN009281 [Ephemera danica]